MRPLFPFGGRINEGETSTAGTRNDHLHECDACHLRDGGNPGRRTNLSNAAVTGSAVVAEAERFLGYPYAYTGDSPATGFSCIGFVWYVYHVLGENIPGTNPTAVNAYPQVSEADLEPGDLVFFQGTFGMIPFARRYLHRWREDHSCRQPVVRRHNLEVGE